MAKRGNKWIKGWIICQNLLLLYFLEGRGAKEIIIGEQFPPPLEKKHLCIPEGRTCSQSRPGSRVSFANSLLLFLVDYNLVDCGGVRRKSGLLLTERVNSDPDLEQTVKKPRSFKNTRIRIWPNKCTLFNFFFTFNRKVYLNDQYKFFILNLMNK